MATEKGFISAKFFFEKNSVILKSIPNIRGFPAELTGWKTIRMDWASSLAYSWKADGDLRTCLNPTHLNKTIRQNHYMTPLLEEITHELAGSTKFTKVDESSSYYCIVFEYESYLLTTFNTHRG